MRGLARGPINDLPAFVAKVREGLVTRVYMDSYPEDQKQRLAEALAREGFIILPSEGGRGGQFNKITRT